MRDAQRKKPKVPVHAVLTATTNSLIRFIGSDDMTQNQELFQVWLQKLAQWHQTTTPYLFLHTPDIAQAPELVHTLWEDLRKTLPEIGAVPGYSTAIFSFLNLPPIIDRCNRPFKGSLYGKRAVCRFKCVVINEVLF